MQIEEYQSLAMRTSPEGHDRVLNGCMGLIGESGEIVDLVKKWKFQSGDHADLPKEKLIEECGDVLWYCAELASGLNKNLAEIYENVNSFYDVMREIDRETPIEIMVMRLAMIAVRPTRYLYDGPLPESWEIDTVRMESAAAAEIVGIMTLIRNMLEIHCETTMLCAMEQNIDKLRKRYPDGFDPERSLHREQ